LRFLLSLKTFKIKEEETIFDGRSTEMPSETATKKIIYYQPIGRCDTGKPRRRQWDI
jgi:hypothetical protein